jgi:hypothetical protein
MHSASKFNQFCCCFMFSTTSFLIQEDDFFFDHFRVFLSIDLLNYNNFRNKTSKFQFLGYTIQ